MSELTSALNLMRRMPPSSVENSLAGMIELVPDLTEELLNHVDQPLKVMKRHQSAARFHSLRLQPRRGLLSVSVVELVLPRAG